MDTGLPVQRAQAWGDLEVTQREQLASWVFKNTKGHFPAEKGADLFRYKK